MLIVANRLGKKPAVHDTRTLRLARFFKDNLPPAPTSVDYSTKVADWGMLANDAVGNCTIATALHTIKEWEANAGDVDPLFTDADAIALYSEITGYDPTDPDSDQGAVELDVLKYWRKVGMKGHKILGFAALDPRNVEHIKQTVYLFEGCYIGLALPLSCQDQETWDVPHMGLHGDGEPGSWGGHAVNVVGYDAWGLTIITWGQTKRMTWAFWKAYCDEAWALLSVDMLDPANKAPVGLDLPHLIDALGQVGKPVAPVLRIADPVDPAPVLKKLYVAIATGLGTDFTDASSTGNWNMNAVATQIAAAYPGWEVKIVRHGWNQHAGAPYTDGPDGLCRSIKAEILAYAPDEIILLGHSFGGALWMFFVVWLWWWYSGEDHSTPPFTVKMVLFDPVPNSVQFGAGQCVGWSVPATVVKACLCFVQRAGVLLGIKGEPVRPQAGVTNVNVTTYRTPMLGHVDFWGLVCLIKDSRVVKIVLDWVVGFLQPKGTKR